MKNQDLNFHLKVVCGHLENLNSSDRAKGAHMNKKLIFQYLDFFANISRYGKDQQLKFGQLAVFDLLEITIGLDHDCGAHRNQKINKKMDQI